MLYAAELLETAVHRYCYHRDYRMYASYIAHRAQYFCAVPSKEFDPTSPGSNIESLRV